MTQLTRRNFIKNASGASVALWLGLSLDGKAQVMAGPAQAVNFTPYILIEPGGGITIFNTKPEMGQGTFQSIPAIIAEELEVSLSQVTIKNTNGEKEFGPGQSAGGSASIRTSYNNLRKVGAAAKEMLVNAASTRWGVAANECVAKEGVVIHKGSDKKLTYGELAEEAAKLTTPKEPKLKDPKDFTIIGKNEKRPDILLKVNGKAEFGIDAEVPGMLYASVERCAVIGGALKSFDDTAALKVPGVVKVVTAEKLMGKYRTTGVAVIASNYWAAVQGRKALKIVWDTKGNEKFNTAEYEKNLRLLAKEPGLLDKNIGAADTVALDAANTIEAFYETPMVAHHALEPISCVAYVQGEQLEIWTSTQVPSAVTGSGANNLHKQVGFKPENIKLHNKFIGGGFGRRLYVDFIIEAVNIAKQIDKPVKVIWTREDTTQFSPHRPMTFSQLKGGFSKDGALTMFQHKVISPSYFEAMADQYDRTKVDGIMVEGIGEQEYEIPNLKTSFVRADFHVPIAAWRSVTSSTVAFAHECFIDELAHKVKKDPLDFRLSLLTKPSDTKRVLQKLKEVSGWGKPLGKNKGRGVAVWKFFAGLCGQIVEVTYNAATKSVKINKVIAVIDLGEVVNPDTVKAQVEGGIIMGLTAAIKTGITLEGGMIKQKNFNDSPVARITEIPPIEVHILAEGGTIKGVGEPGLPPFAPALANAIFAASGKRIRKLPFDIDKI